MTRRWDWHRLEGCRSLGAGRRLVIVAVGAPDRRVTAAAWYASRFAAADHRGVHVATGAVEVDALGRWWADVQPHGLELEVIDDRGGVAASISEMARVQHAGGFDDVVVLAGCLSTPGLGRWVLHDRTAEAIRDAVNRVPGARGVLVPVHAHQ